MNSNAAQQLSDPRRVHDRTSLEIEVSLESDHNFFMGLTENISEGGLFVCTHRLLEIGSCIEITLALPGPYAPVKLQAIVRWVRIFNVASDTSPGMGLQFLDPPAATTDAIRSFLMLRPALFWE